MIRRALLPLALIACQGPAEPEPEVRTLDTIEAAETLAREGIERRPTDTVGLGWIETVWAHGLLALHRATGDDAYHDYNVAWLQRHLPEFATDPPRAFTSSDSMAPASVASELMRIDGSLALTPLTDAAHAYLAEANLTAEGAITHWGEAPPFLDDDEVWVDSLFMFGMFLLSEHERTGDRAHLERFVEQYVLYSELCRDPVDQLYRHAYKDATGLNIPQSDTYWARGNSWVLIAGAEALARIDQGDPAYGTLAPLVEAHAGAVIDHQADDGLWHTVMNRPRGDDPANYTETSASALLAYGLLRGAETVVPPERALPAVHAAVAGIEGRLRQRESHLGLTGTSFGTNPGDYDYYVGVPVADDLMLGVGSVILLLSEVHGLEVE